MKETVNCKIFRISQELKPFLDDELYRSGLFYVYRGLEKVKVQCSGKTFHKLIIRAKCEKLNREHGLSEEETYYVSKLESPWELGERGYLIFYEYPLQNDKR